MATDDNVKSLSQVHTCLTTTLRRFQSDVSCFLVIEIVHFPTQKKIISNLTDKVLTRFQSLLQAMLFDWKIYILCNNKVNISKSKESEMRNWTTRWSTNMHSTRECLEIGEVDQRRMQLQLLISTDFSSSHSCHQLRVNFWVNESENASHQESLNKFNYVGRIELPFMSSKWR